ncbi:MAG: hypothetical protein EOP34_02040 [Rickettsiales bacterium]|nr:MAG: hypothetical protein EOP34_02040 [Rickettsiales bacterium]
MSRFKAVFSTVSSALRKPIRITVKTISFVTLHSILLFTILLAILATQYINKAGVAFQTKLQTDEKFSKQTVEFVNTVIDIYNAMFKIMQILIEIWNLTLPFANFLIFFFYQVAVAVFLTLYKDDATPSKGTYDDNKLPINERKYASDSAIEALECIAVDAMILGTSILKTTLRNFARILQAVLKSINTSSKKQWYREEYCRMNMGSSSNQGGPEGTCSDNTLMIKSISDVYTKITSVLADLVVETLPIVGPVIKSMFETFMKIMPQFLEGITQIIEIFLPGNPLGDALYAFLNFFLQMLGYISKSCFLQLLTAFVTCIFNNLIALVANVVVGFIKVILKIVCLGGEACQAKFKVNYMKFGGCGSLTSSSCINKAYATVSFAPHMCNVSRCMSRAESYRHLYEVKGKHILGEKSNTNDRIQQYQECVRTYAANYTYKEDTIEGYYFCHHLSEFVHNDIILKSSAKYLASPIDSVEEMCIENTENSCMCKYESPICESETCCFSHYTILMGQMMTSFGIDTCEDYKNMGESRFKLGCISKTSSSFSLTPHDLIGTLHNCEAVVELMDQFCSQHKNDTIIDRKSVTGGICTYINESGFCDKYRRPDIDLSKIVEHITEKYNNFHSDQRIVPTERGKYRRKYKSSHIKRSDDERPHRKLWPAEIYRRDIALINQHKDIMLTVFTTVYPLAKSIITGSYDSKTINSAIPRLFSSFENPSGSDSRSDKLYPFLLDHNYKWDDMKFNKEKKLFETSGETFSHHEHFSDYYTNGTLKPQRNFFLRADSSCSGTSINNIYPSDQQFGCIRDRVSSAESYSTTSNDKIVGQNGAINQVTDMSIYKTSPIKTKAIESVSFDPIREYGNIMFDKNLATDATFDTNPPDNLNPRYREPLQKNGNKGNNPGPIHLYGHQKTDLTSIQECPISSDFPWEKVFISSDSRTVADIFMGNLLKLGDNIAFDINIDNKNISLRNRFKLPPLIKKSMEAMYMKRSSGFINHISNLYASANDLASGLYNVYTLKDEIIYDSNIKSPNNTGYIVFSERPSTLKHTTYNYPSSHHKSFSISKTNTDLCIANVDEPYECCADDTSAYQCCFGLLFCIPPLGNYTLNRISNFSFIANATCSNPSTAISTILLLPRLVFSNFLWSKIDDAPPWSREILFNIALPLIYDHGGQGVSLNLYSDLFCMFMNLQYVAYLVAFSVFQSYFNSTFVSAARSVKIRAQTALADMHATEKEF